MLSLAVSRDMTYISSGSMDKALRIWDFQGNCLRKILVGHRGAIESTKIMLGNKYAVSASHDCTFIVWKIQRKTLLHQSTRFNFRDFIIYL